MVRRNVRQSGKLNLTKRMNIARSLCVCEWSKYTRDGCKTQLHPVCYVHVYIRGHITTHAANRLHKLLTNCTRCFHSLYVFLRVPRFMLWIENIRSMSMKPLSIMRYGVQGALSLTRNDSTISTNSRGSRKDKKNSQASR